MIYLIGKPRDYFAALQRTLQELGFKCEFGNLSNPSEKDLYIGQFKKYNSQIVPKNYIVYTHNFFGDPEVRQNYRNSNSINKLTDNALAIWSYEERDQQLITKTYPGKPCQIVPFGYSSYYEDIFHPIPGIKKDIDIFFYGLYRDRRKNFINRLRKEGYKVVWKGERGVRDRIFGNERDRLIHRAKLVISINQRGQKDIGNNLSRLSFLMANRIFVISEFTPGSMIEELRKHCVMYETADELVSLVAKYINNPDLQKEEAEKSYNYVKEHLRTEQFLPMEILENYRD